jgi:hypothetical protein
VALELNALYGVNLPHLTWRDFAMKRRDIADPKTRAALLLGPRPCPTCRDNPTRHFSNLLKRLRPNDLKRWQRLHDDGKYREARQFINEVYNRKVKQR